MAQTTPNFGFNIAEGTDTVNLLTQCYPNFTSLDSILQAIKESGVTTAVATKTGTNFAVVRTDTDCNFFRFIATANYASGDTFTVDGVAVTATSPAGTALPAGAFVINQSVIAVLNSSVLTLFVGGGASTIDAEDVDYDNSGSGLTATDVQAAIDEVLGDIPTGFAATAISYDNTVSGLTATNAQAAIDELAANAPGFVSVTADGVKTYSTLFDELYALADGSKVSSKSSLDLGSNNFPNRERSTTLLGFGGGYVPQNNVFRITGIQLKSSGSTYYEFESGTYHEYSALKPTNGTIIKLYY